MRAFNWIIFLIFSYLFTQDVHTSWLLLALCWFTYLPFFFFNYSMINSFFQILLPLPLQPNLWNPLNIIRLYYHTFTIFFPPKPIFIFFRSWQFKVITNDFDFSGTYFLDDKRRKLCLVDVQNTTIFLFVIQKHIKIYKTNVYFKVYKQV